MILILFDGKLYRPAGFRSPFPGESYISKDGKIKVCNMAALAVIMSIRNQARTIVRQVFIIDQEIK